MGVYKTRNAEIPGNIKSIRYSGPEDLFNYDENGNHDYYNPENKKTNENDVAARMIKTDTRFIYYVAVDKNKELYDPFKKKYDKMYFLRMKDSANNKKFNLTPCSKNIFVNYLKYLQSKQKRFLSAAQELIV
jgi:hypothetical protein